MATNAYKQLAKRLAEVVTRSTGHMLIERNSSGKKPPYPFCTYTFTSPYVAITSGIVEHEVFECTISLTWHGESGLEVLDLAYKTNKWLRSFAGRSFLSTHQIAVVSVEGTEQQSNLISTRHERLAGLNIKLRVKDDYIDDDVEFIKTVEI